jgi:hypothetical protein
MIDPAALNGSIEFLVSLSDGNGLRAFCEITLGIRKVTGGARRTRHQHCRSSVYKGQNTGIRSVPRSRTIRLSGIPSLR